MKLASLSESRLKEEQKRRVHVGAILLDMKVPGWAHTIFDSMTRGLFKIDNWECCVLGTLEIVQHRQLVGMYWPQPYIVLNGVELERREYCDILGFTPLPELHELVGGVSGAFRFLDECWRAEIEQRIGEKPKDPDADEDWPIEEV